MSQPTEWKIELRQNTFVPGRFAPVTYGDWWVIVNPHGGIQAFCTTKQDAESTFDQVKRDSHCQCGHCVKRKFDNSKREETKMRWLAKKRQEVFRRWRADEITLVFAVRELVALGYSADQAWESLART